MHEQPRGGAVLPRAVSVRVGMEATGYAFWFERLLAELNFELWVGEAAHGNKSIRRLKESPVPVLEPVPVRGVTETSLLFTCRLGSSICEFGGRGWSGLVPQVFF
jgi:hypothetical protein